MTQKLPEELSNNMVFYCKKCISGFILSIIFSFLPLLAAFSHELQSNPLYLMIYCVMAIGLYVFGIVLSLIGLKEEKNVRVLLTTKGKELGYIGIGISAVGIIACIILIVVAALAS